MRTKREHGLMDNRQIGGSKTASSSPQTTDRDSQEMSATAAPNVVGGGLFVDRAYRNALALVHEARNYMAYGEAADSDTVPVSTRLLISQESLRITSRLTQAMAWLFAQKAAAAGEMPMSRALSEEFAPAAEAVCLEDGWADDAEIPPALRDLMRRSLSLYRQVQRMHATACG